MQAASRCMGRKHNRGSCSVTAWPSNEDSEAAQTHARPHSRVHHTRRPVNDGSGQFIQVLVVSCVDRPKAGRIAGEYPRMIWCLTRLAHTNTNAPPVNSYVGGRISVQPHPPQRLSRLQELVKSGGCGAASTTALLQRISWPEDASRDAAPRCI